LYPTRGGEITIKPAAVVLPETVYQPRREIRSNEIIVQVQPLPPGAPAGFEGGVGEFEISAELDRSAIAAGEIINLTLTVSGIGNIEQMSMPTMPTPEGWQIYPGETSYSASRNERGQLMGRKVYHVLLAPTQVTAQPFPSINWVYFDPDRLVYRSTSTQPIPLRVVAAPPSTQPSTSQVPMATDSGRLAIKTTITSESEITSPNAGDWLAWLTPPIVLVTAILWKRSKRWRIQHDVRIRRTQALNRAQRALSGLQGTQGHQAAYAAVSGVIFGYFDDKLGGEPGHLTHDALSQIMERMAAPLEVKQAVLACLELAQESQYAPAFDSDFQTFLKRAHQALMTLDSAWKLE
jgi:hypothetical protein